MWCEFNTLPWVIYSVLYVKMNWDALIKTMYMILCLCKFLWRRNKQTWPPLWFACVNPPTRLPLSRTRIGISGMGGDYHFCIVTISLILLQNQWNHKSFIVLVVHPKIFIHLYAFGKYDFLSYREQKYLKRLFSVYCTVVYINVNTNEWALKIVEGIIFSL